MIKSKVQTALDTALYAAGVYSYWQRKSGADVNEYIVYTRGGTSDEFYADDAPLLMDSSITVKYYYRAEMINTHTGREAVKTREITVQTALESAGFVISDGPFDAGDVDDIGYFVTVFECDYEWVV